MALEVHRKMHIRTYIGRWEIRRTTIQHSKLKLITMFSVFFFSFSHSIFTTKQKFNYRIEEIQAIWSWVFIHFDLEIVGGTIKRTTTTTRLLLS